MKVEEQYLALLDRILTRGTKKEDRTGIGTYSVFGAEIRHDMADGFPLITTRQAPYKGVRVELDGFIHSVTNKQWFHDNGCFFWDRWARRDKVSYANDEKTKAIMRAFIDLGPIYGFQWKHFGAKYINCHTDYAGQGIDQLAKAIETLKRDSDSRKVHVSAWNPEQLHMMAIEPCHYGFTLNISDGRLNLAWSQRSVDTPIGLVSNLASYATLNHLLSKILGLNEGKVVGHLEDVHIYLNQVDKVKEQLGREPKKLPKIVTKKFITIDDWTFDKTELIDYHPHPKIDYPLAI